MNEGKSFEMDFKFVCEFGEKHRKFGGRYLVTTLFVEFTLWDESLSFAKQFILDTGSPVTFIRRNTFEKNSCNPLSSLEEEEFGPIDRPIMKARRIPSVVRLPRVSIELPKVYITPPEYDKPFGLLGTDFLENFFLQFDPQMAKAYFLCVDG